MGRGWEQGSELLLTLRPYVVAVDSGWMDGMYREREWNGIYKTKLVSSSALGKEAPISSTFKFTCPQGIQLCSLFLSCQQGFNSPALHYCCPALVSSPASFSSLSLLQTTGHAIHQVNIFLVSVPHFNNLPSTGDVEKGG